MHRTPFPWQPILQEKSLAPSQSALCAHRSPSAEGREGGTRCCTQQGWCVPGDELFLSMGCACCGGAGGKGGTTKVN